MRKALWALAVVAGVALGTSIITAVLDGSAQARESRQIATLEHEQAVDRKEITALAGELHTTNATARRQAEQTSKRCVEAQPTAQPGLADASPALLFSFRGDSLTAWIARAGNLVRSDAGASGGQCE